LNPERSAIIRKVPGGCSQDDFATITAGVAELDSWLGDRTTIPVTKTITSTIIAARRAIMKNFCLEAIVVPSFTRSF
jgi:hypothetical protein